MITKFISIFKLLSAKNRVIHARLDDETHDQLFEKCNELGCSFTEYIAEVVRSSLEDDKSDPEPKSKVREIAQGKIVSINDEPVTEVENVEVVY